MGQMEQQMPYDERDDESGQFRPTFDDTEFLDAISTVNVATTSNVADEVGCEYQTAYTRLQKLADADLVESEMVGNSLVWDRLDTDRE